MKKKGLLARVLGSFFFKQAGAKAVRYASNTRSLFELVRDSVQKSGGLSGENVALFRQQVSLLARMVKAYASGQYRQIPWQTLTKMVAVLIYFVSPIDFLPDILPVIGIADDIALVAWLIGSIQGDIEHFRHWEKSQNVVEIG